jgi:ABC-type amino acid transport substrate-binding protein
LEYVQSSFASLLGDVTTDKCDIAMFAIGNTSARAKEVRFTTPSFK